MLARWLYVLVLIQLMPVSVISQEVYSLGGKVLDEQGNPLPGCHVHIDSLCSITDFDGNFLFESLPVGEHSVLASYVGFGDNLFTIYLNKNTTKDIQLNPEMSELDEFVVQGDYNNLRKQQQTVQLEIVDESFTRQNQAGSLMKTLERLPGISTIDIGAGQSKPLIRGLGFNRVVVAENGIKHQSQQWGTDHGLEMDAFNVAEVEVLKGPASLEFGSDAMGGVIHVIPAKKPINAGLSGNLTLQAASVNRQAGSSLYLANRKDNKWFAIRLTAITNGDYQVPTEKVTYNTFDFELDNGFLRNTAGREMNVFASGGFHHKRGEHKVSFGNYFNRSGFYADAHGFEIRNSKIDYDHSNRDIDLPYQQVNHAKLLSNSIWYFGRDKLELDAAWQNNYRQEFSEPTAHGYRPVPEDSLERVFRKNIASLNLVYAKNFSNDNQIRYGFNSEWQQNRIGGWGFIIPDFDHLSAGVFAIGRIYLNDHLLMTGGLRYDFGSVSIHSYTDWYETPVANDEGGTDWVFRERAENFTKQFNDFSGSVGLSYSRGYWNLKANIGKSFRMPDARELAVDGVNYHMFRQEKGDPNLGSEVAYQADVSLGFDNDVSSFSLSPFYSYFPNYIYLNPTSVFNEETGLQQFNYVQEEVLRWGGEAAVSQQIMRQLEASGHFEYLFSEQLSGNKQGFGLAFSPPASALFSLRWSPELQRSSENYLALDYHVVAKQTRIVPPEEPTDGYQLFHLKAGTRVAISDHQMNIYFQIRNLFNKKYFNHTSFYRLINVPGPGRSFQVTLVLDLNKQQ